MLLKRVIKGFACALLAGGAVAASADFACAQLVPGTGMKVRQYGDDFEDENWKFVHNFPKSSKEQDEQLRYPRGYSVNKRWFESPKRGQPDSILRVPCPPGGLPGSEFALALKSVNTGIPGRPSYEQQQDDLLMNGVAVPVSYLPSGVVRVYLPPFEQWENRSGAQFGIRADCHTTKYEDEPVKSRKGLRLFEKMTRQKVEEPYWPGFFICFNSETDPKVSQDSAYILIRGDHLGREIPGPRISQPGWWTFGISVTADGQVHFYASPGVDDLTEADHITSQFSYGYQAERFSTIFFNSVTPDDGRTCSTEFIIDDPALYYGSMRGEQAARGGTTRR